MRARDVHDKLKDDLSSQPRLLEVLCKLAEEQHALSRAIPALAEQVDRLATLMQTHTRIMGDQQDVIDALKKRGKDVASLGTAEG